MSRPDWRWAAALIAALTAWRIIALGFDSTDLWVDEAQYWLWSQHLDWGYFSKPPMIAFVLRAVTDLAGSDSQFWIRAPGAVLHAITAGLIWLSAARLFDGRTGALAALFYVTAPFVTLGSWLFSTDTVMLPFFALALYAWLRLRDASSTRWALVFGVALGLGFLSKYAVIYLPISLALAAVFIPTARIAWRDTALAAVAALVVASPNLIWNLAHDGTTVRHIAEDNARVGSAGFEPGKAAEFLLSQFAVFGPILFACLIWALWLLARRRAPQHGNVLAILSLTVIALMTVQAARAGANANWAVTAYVAGSILTASILIGHPRWVALSLGLHLLVAVLFPFAFIKAETLTLPNGTLLAERYVGQKDLSQQVLLAYKTHATSEVIVAERRGVLANLFHTFHEKGLLGDGGIAIHAPPPDGHPANYYEQAFPLPEGETRDVFYVTSGEPPCPEAVLVETYQPPQGRYRNTAFRFYLTPAQCFRGPS